MNADRRKRITVLKEAINKMRVELEAVRDGDADQLKNEEREAFENLSEGLQQSERGQQAEAAADALETAYDAIESAASSLEEAYEAYEEAEQ